MSQTVTGPGGLFHEAKVDGYPAYDPERAKRLVREVGGLDITLGTLSTPVAEQVMTALQTQWRQAGINVRIDELPPQPRAGIIVALAEQIS